MRVTWKDFVGRCSIRPRDFLGGIRNCGEHLRIDITFRVGIVVVLNQYFLIRGFHET
jgi:hypothetical protein